MAIRYNLYNPSNAASPHYVFYTDVYITSVKQLKLVLRYIEFPYELVTASIVKNQINITVFQDGKVRAWQAGYPGEIDVIQLPEEEEGDLREPLNDIQDKWQCPVCLGKPDSVYCENCNGTGFDIESF